VYSDFDTYAMDPKQKRSDLSKSKVVNLAVYRAQKSLREEGFDLIMNEEGKLTLVLRLSNPQEKQR
jgi:hypothetical protein